MLNQKSLKRVLFRAPLQLQKCVKTEFVEEFKLWAFVKAAISGTVFLQERSLREIQLYNDLAFDVFISCEMLLVNLQILIEATLL